MGNQDLYVVSGRGPSLLGRNWLSVIKLDWASIKAVRVSKSALDKLMEKYSEVFKDSNGTILKHTAWLGLKSEASPQFCHPRPVPFSIRFFGWSCQLVRSWTD